MAKQNKKDFSAITQAIAKPTVEKKQTKPQVQDTFFGIEPVGEKSKNKGGRPVEKKDAVRENYYFEARIKEMVDNGSLKEGFRSKSRFVEYILEEYFKNKPYYIPEQE